MRPRPHLGPRGRNRGRRARVRPCGRRLGQAVPVPDGTLGLLFTQVPRGRRYQRQVVAEGHHPASIQQQGRAQDGDRRGASVREQPLRGAGAGQARVSDKWHHRRAQRARAEPNRHRDLDGHRHANVFRHRHPRPQQRAHDLWRRAVRGRSYAFRALAHRLQVGPGRPGRHRPRHLRPQCGPRRHPSLDALVRPVPCEQAGHV
jgi:hypothetical protein